MNRIAVLLICLTSSSLIIAQRIAGSAHDFSAKGWNKGQEICQVCHTPHRAVFEGPLWNHEVTTQVFNLYASPTLDAHDLGQPSGVSKLCLSCHDGTVALDSYGNDIGHEMIAGEVLIGTDLADHPISFTYDEELATKDGELFNPKNHPSGLGRSVAEDLLQDSTQMECSSCHDVHNRMGIQKLLRKSNEGSALCLTCHDK